jgi:hypothetical protein
VSVRGTPLCNRVGAKAFLVPPSRRRPPFPTLSWGAVAPFVTTVISLLVLKPQRPDSTTISMVSSYPSPTPIGLASCLLVIVCSWQTAGNDYSTLAMSTTQYIEYECTPASFQPVQRHPMRWLEWEQDYLMGRSSGQSRRQRGGRTRGSKAFSIVP